MWFDRDNSVCVSFFLHLVKSNSAWKVKWFFIINLNWTAKKTVENVLHVVEKRNFTETISECPALDYFLMNWTTTGKCGTNGNWQIFDRIFKKTPQWTSCEILCEIENLILSWKTYKSLHIYYEHYWFQSIIICTVLTS